MKTKKLKVLLIISLVVLATVAFLYVKALKDIREYNEGSTSILQIKPGTFSIQGEMN